MSGVATFRTRPLTGALTKALTGLGATPYVPHGLIKIASFGDSRATLTDTGGVDMNDRTAYPIRPNYDTQPSAMCSIPFFVRDCELVCNGGVSGSRAEDWDSGSRTITLAQIIAVDSDLVVVQYGTNDIQLLVTDATSRDTTATALTGHLQDIITYFLGQGRKVLFQTIMQRTSAAYSTGTVFKRDCCDTVNTAMVAWVQAHASYGTDLALSDLRVLTTGATSGAYATTTYLPDGTHPGWLGGIEIARIDQAGIRMLYPTDEGQYPMVGCTGNNLVNGLSSANVFNPSTGASNATGGAFTFGTDADGLPYVEQVVTLTGANAALPIDIHCDVGSNGGRTPPNTITAGDVLNARAMVTITDGAGNFSPKVWNIHTQLLCTYIGGTPGLDVLRNGQATNGSSVMQGTFENAAHQIWGMTLGGGSSSIGAPSNENGLRMQIRPYATTGTGTFTIRITDPQVRKQA